MRALLLLLVSATASADPRVCKPHGDVLVEIDQRVMPSSKRSTSTTQLFDNGAWTTQIFDRGKLARAMAGCLETAQIESVQRDLKTASWKTGPKNAACTSDAPRFKIYKLHGRAVHTARPCDGALEDATIHTIFGLEGLVELPDLDLAGDPVRRGLPARCRDNPLGPGCS